MIGDELVRPRSIEETCALLARRHADGQRTVLLAGGTDLIVEEHLAPPSSSAPAKRLVVDVSSLRELHRIEERGDVIRLGGGVTYLALRTDPRITTRLPLLTAMAKDVGALQIQARGTLAGNLATASPAADGTCALAALDTVIGLASVRGEREVPLSAFYRGYKQTEREPDELIAWIDVRVPSVGARWAWRKVGTRLAQAISKVALAATVELTDGVVHDVRLGMASVAPTTAFLPKTRASLEGRALGALDVDATLAALGEDIAPIDDVRSTAHYRLHVARALIRELVRGFG
ncbi:MAG: hypothetical protein NVSMB47_18000 [Polyangiales bacterium]